MTPIIDNLEYNGPLPNFSRDNMTWNEMLNVNESILDKGHIVYCTDDLYGFRWVVDEQYSQEDSTGEVSTLEELEELLPSESDIIWVIEEEACYVWREVKIQDKKGHYIFLGVTQEEGELEPTPKWVLAFDPSGSANHPIPISFIEELSDEYPVTEETNNENPEPTTPTDDNTEDPEEPTIDNGD